MQSTGRCSCEPSARGWRTSGRSPPFDDRPIEDFLETQYSDWDGFLALSLLYDNANWGHMPHELDHIFPQKMFDEVLR